MNRRAMMKRIGVGTAVVAVGGPVVLLQTGCKVKDIAFYVSTVVGTLGELSPLIPGAAGLIAQAVTAANDFLAAYKAGKLDNAKDIFSNLVGLLTQISGDIGFNNPTVKIIFAIASVAVHAIAALLAGQAPAAAVSAKARASMTSGQRQAVALIERLSNPATIDQISASTKF